jgi:hypothetical protein
VRKSKGQQNENEIHGFQLFVAQARLSVVPEFRSAILQNRTFFADWKTGNQLAFERKRFPAFPYGAPKCD